MQTYLKPFSLLCVLSHIRGRTGKQRYDVRPVAPVWKYTSGYGEGSHYLWSPSLGAAGCLADADTKYSPGEASWASHSSWGSSPVTLRAAQAGCLQLSIEASPRWDSALRNLDVLLTESPILLSNLVPVLGVENLLGHESTVEFLWSLNYVWLFLRRRLPEHVAAVSGMKLQQKMQLIYASNTKVCDSSPKFHLSHFSEGEGGGFCSSLGIWSVSLVVPVSPKTWSCGYGTPLLPHGIC